MHCQPPVTLFLTPSPFLPEVIGPQFIRAYH
jgi:hypothetical protein